MLLKNIHLGLPGSLIETVIEGPFLPLAEMCSLKFYYHIAHY